ncbi:MAG: family 20 glycosylhydrolase [Promethearchaeota archaeon]
MFIAPERRKYFEFLEDVLEEVINLFPFEIIHLGGDEVPKDRWENCPECQQRIHSENLRDEDALQGYFTNRIVDFLGKKGKIAMIWNERYNMNIRKDVIFQYWHKDEKNLLEKLKSGRKFVMSNCSYLYLDYNYRILPLSKTYSFEPIPLHIDDEYQANILGVEAPMWTEWTRHKEVSTQVGDITIPKSPILHIPISYPIDNDGMILLNWSKIDMEDILSCNLYRSKTPNFQLNSSTFLRSILTSTATYSDQVIKNGNYYYKITAIDINQLESLPSNEVNTTYIDCIKPSKPSGLNFEIKNDEVLLEWDKNEDLDIDHYVVYKSKNKITSDNVNSLNPLATISTTSLVDDDIKEGKNYYYVILAKDVNGLNSDLSQNLKVSIPEQSLFTSNEIILILILSTSMISILLVSVAILINKKKNGIWIWENLSLKLKLHKFKSRFSTMRKTSKPLKELKAKQLRKKKRIITQIEEVKELDTELTEEELDFLKNIKPSEKLKEFRNLKMPR